MGASIEIRLEGADGALRALSALLVRFGDLTPLMQRVAEYMRTSTVERFQTNLGPTGAPWIPSLRARLTGGRTLVEHGVLRDSIATAWGRDYAEVGTNDPRAAAHQFGVTIRPKSAKALAFSLPGVGFRMVKSVTLPARPFLGLSDVDRAKILDLSADYAIEASDGEHGP